MSVIIKQHQPNKKTHIKETPIDNLPTVEQIRNTLKGAEDVCIKPNNKYTYYHGEAIGIPPQIQALTVKDISIRTAGTLALFVEDNRELSIKAKEEYEKEAGYELYIPDDDNIDDYSDLLIDLDEDDLK